MPAKPNAEDKWPQRPTANGVDQEEKILSLLVTRSNLSETKKSKQTWIRATHSNLSLSSQLLWICSKRMTSAQKFKRSLGKSEVLSQKQNKYNRKKTKTSSPPCSPPPVISSRPSSCCICFSLRPSFCLQPSRTLAKLSAAWYLLVNGAHGNFLAGT